MQEAAPSPALDQGIDERQERHPAEEQQSPRADRHRRPPLEHRQPTLALHDHVPKALGSPEVGDQQDSAQGEQRKGEQVAKPNRAVVLGFADQLEQRGAEITARGDPTEEKVEHDEPTPLGRGESLGGHLKPPRASPE